MLKTLKNIRRRDTDKFMIPHSVQEVIPIRTVWKSGILLVGQNRYSRTWQFSDINYALAGEEDQKSMLLGYSALLNLCDSNADTKLSIVTRKLNRRDFEEYIMIPYENDGRDHYRKEYNDMLLEKASHASGMIRDLYITVTITRKSYKEAESYFARTGSEYTLALSRLGSRCTELDMMDRLRILHGFFRHGEEADFHFDPKLSMKLGHSFKDYICPDSFEFDRDCFRLGDRYGRVLFLKDYAAYLRDDILSELSGIDRPMILSIDVVPIPMDEAIRDGESRLLGVERNIVDFLRKQQQNNNFSGTIPYDMEKQRAEMKEFLDDLTSRDQRMLLGMVTLVHLGEKKIADVTLDDIQLALVPVSKKSASVYKSVIVIYKCIFRAAEESRIIKKNPTVYLSPKGGGVPQAEKQPLTDEQVQRLLDAVRGLPPYVFIMLGLYAGLRREEILGLQWDSVYLDTEAPYLTVRRAWHTEHNRPVISTELKTAAAERNIPLPDHLAACLREAKKKSTSDFVVANRDGNPLSYTQFKRLWQYVVTRTAKPRIARKQVDGKYVKYMLYPELGEKARNNGHVVYSLDFEVTPHLLRHTYITNLIHASVDPKTVQYLAGHENSRITMDIYAKVKYNRPDDVVKAMTSAFAEWDAS